MTVHLGIKSGTRRQHVGRVKMLTWFEYAADPALQTNLHLAVQNKHPLRVWGTVELASKTHGAFPQLQAT